MNFSRASVTSSVAAAVIVSCLGANAQSENTPASIQQKLESQYALTKSTADRTDIVTAGTVLVLEKDNLLMYTITTRAPASNTYKNGRISNFSITKCPPFVPCESVGIHNVDSRKFVAGEKFWVTKIDVHDDGVVFDLLSDPISDVRYYSTLKFPFPKGSPPPADTVMSTVAQVLKVQPAEDSGSSGGDSQAPAAPPTQTAQAGSPPAEQAPQQVEHAPMAPIAPPPPPADAPPPAPKTIAVGQTKEQVIAVFGQPTKIIKLGGKEIDVYPDMKVTFVSNKVTDVQ